MQQNRVGWHFQRGTEMHHLICLLEKVNILLVNKFYIKVISKINVDIILVIFEERQCVGMITNGLVVGVNYP